MMRCGAGDDVNVIQHNFGSELYTLNYGYDASHQVTNFEATYTPAGGQASDRTPTPASAASTTATYNALNQLVIAGCTVASGCYDKNGNLLSDGVRTFSYDNEGDGRILTATNGSTTASYGYNPDGQRVSKTVNGTTTAYASDAAGHEIAEISGGQIQHFYL